MSYFIILCIYNTIHGELYSTTCISIYCGIRYLQSVQPPHCLIAIYRPSPFFPTFTPPFARPSSINAFRQLFRSPQPGSCQGSSPVVFHRYNRYYTYNSCCCYYRCYHHYTYTQTRLLQHHTAPHSTVASTHPQQHPTHLSPGRARFVNPFPLPPLSFPSLHRTRNYHKLP